MMIVTDVGSVRILRPSVEVIEFSTCHGRADDLPVLCSRLPSSTGSTMLVIISSYNHNGALVNKG